MSQTSQGGLLYKITIELVSHSLVNDYSGTRMSTAAQLHTGSAILSRFRHTQLETGRRHVGIKVLAPGYILLASYRDESHSIFWLVYCYFHLFWEKIHFDVASVIYMLMVCPLLLLEF